jgi:hypothetical protein
MRVAHRRRLHVERALHQLDRVHAAVPNSCEHVTFPWARRCTSPTRCRPWPGTARRRPRSFQDLLDEGLDVSAGIHTAPSRGSMDAGWQVFGDHLSSAADVRARSRSRSQRLRAACASRCPTGTRRPFRGRRFRGSCRSGRAPPGRRPLHASACSSSAM